MIVSMCASSGEGTPRGIEFLLNLNWLNVALSRAQSLAIVVASPRLARMRVNSVAQMKLVNLFCRIVREGTAAGPRANEQSSSVESADGLGLQDLVRWLAHAF